MIISASRRTDIPCYYSDWFYNRIKDGFVLVRNPMNAHQISKISLSPEIVDCIVFWTKNPKGMLNRLSELKEYHYYFQFTLNSYGNDVEVNLPSKSKSLIYTFQMLSEIVGPERVIWRYDPIFLNKKYTLEYHLENFEKIAFHLSNYTHKCTFSFMDFYSSINVNIKDLEILQMEQYDKLLIAKGLSDISRKYNLELDTCAEDINLDEFGIKHARCIDDRLISSIIGYQINVVKDKNQRLECGCVASIDIGLYNTCKNGCKYCYANHSQNTVSKNSHEYDPLSSLLCGKLSENDIVKEREVKSLKREQIDLFSMIS